MNLLSVTSEDIGDKGYDHIFGYGLVDFESFISKMIESTEVFISPLYEENGKIYGVIYNNVNVPKKYTLIGAHYNGSQFLGMTPQTLTLATKQKYLLETPAEGNLVKYMVWNDLSKLFPESEVRLLKR